MLHDIRLRFWALVVAGLVLCGVVAPQLHGEGSDMNPVMTAYRDALIDQLDKLEDSLPEMSQSAEVVAERLLAGGSLYVAGQEAFVSASHKRAGGMMMALAYNDKTRAPYKEKIPLTANDVVLVGAWANDEERAIEACRRAKEAGAYVVLISPAFDDSDAPPAALCDAHIVNFSGGEPAVPVGEGRRVGPTSPLYSVTALWTYTAEIVGSLTRRGKMPMMWQSVLVPGARERNKRYCTTRDPSESRFHDDMTIPAQPAGRLGGLYVDAVRREVAGLRGPVLEQLERAAEDMAACVRAGGAVHVQTISHFTTYEVTSPSVPAWVKAEYDRRRRGTRLSEELGKAMKPGDVFFQLGYYGIAAGGELIEAVRKAGGKSIIALCHAPIAPSDGPQPDMLIDAQWEFGDALILVPGYDAKILPSSGVLQTAIFWTVIGKAESILARK